MVVPPSVTQAEWRGFSPFPGFYDWDAKRFFMTIWITNNVNYTTFMTAVSKTANPLDGWHKYYIDSSGYFLPGCTKNGCLGDYARPGVDKYAFW